MRLSPKVIQVLLIIIVVILVVATLHIARPVIVPLTYACFIAALVYPLQRYLNRYLPHWLSVSLVMLLLGMIIGLGGWALLYSVQTVQEKLPQYQQQIQQSWQSWQSWAQQNHLPVGDVVTEDVVNQFGDSTLPIIKTFWSVLGVFVLVVALLVLLLLEITQYRRKIERSFPTSASRQIIKGAQQMTEKLRRYILIQAFTSVLTGLLTLGLCWLWGVELGFIWGLVAFVLNFVPTLGSIIAVVPPTLLAFLTISVGTSFTFLGSLTMMQLIMGNLVDPMLQGKSLQLSPFMALVSILFWGWVWGIPGALIGVPTTVAVVVFCDQFESTRPIAWLFREDKREDFKK
ncbi:MAG: AI-2E family transporter [Jaaginema sp. PMC 1079.18]|nr:AI-2E family transporter [Jaaginema sp. PMC 1080.18]MEC4851599.1 AI-2E family transporter [Jaaginema sp. PMC 1079.18]MEC4865064.1 AI-2E family transporter [Jaaginema sp. PMC 1078.18]